MLCSSISGTGVKLGDIAYIYWSKNGASTFAIYADVGPSTKIGEGTSDARRYARFSECVTRTHGLACLLHRCSIGEATHVARKQPLQLCRPCDQWHLVGRDDAGVPRHWYRKAAHRVRHSSSWLVGLQQVGRHEPLPIVHLVRSAPSERSLLTVVQALISISNEDCIRYCEQIFLADAARFFRGTKWRAWWRSGARYWWAARCVVGGARLCRFSCRMASHRSPTIEELDAVRGSSQAS